MPKIFIDLGHGGTDPGAIGAGHKESMVVLSIGKMVIAKLRYNEFEVITSRESDEGLSLTERTDKAKANGCDSLLSIHCNAFSDESANGAEIFTYGRGANEIKLAQCIYNDEYRSLGFRDRGIKQGNLHLVREFPRAAVLLEMGFITNDTDREKLLNRQDEISTIIAKGYCSYYGIEYREPVVSAPPSNKPSALYRVKREDGVQLGAFSILENAKLLAQKEKATVYDGDGNVVISYVEKPKKDYLFLKAHVQGWRVYPLDKAPVLANACGTLRPALFGGLEYEILGNPQADVYEIQTQSFGRVKIYVPVDNDSSFYSRS